MGLGILSGLNELRADGVQNRLVKAWNAGQLGLWRSRLKKFGAESAGPETLGEDMQSVRIDSPDQHYHYQVRNGLLGDLAKLAIAAALGAGGLALWSWYNSGTKPNPISTKPVLDPGGLKIDVERPK